jgi:integrase
MASVAVKGKCERATKRSPWCLRCDGAPRPGGGRNQLHRHFPTRDEAETFFAQHCVNDGSVAFDTRLSLGEYLTRRWLPFYQTRCRPSTFGVRETDVRLYLVPALGQTRLTALSPVVVQMFYTNLAPSRKPATIRRIAATLNAALNQAVRWELIPRNPAKGASLPAMPRRPSTVLSPAQERAFLAAEDDDDWRCLWQVLALTGMREGECCALIWEDVDYAAGTIRVERTLTKVPGRGPQGGKTVWAVGPVKAGEGRMVSVPGSLLTLLHSMQQRQEASRVTGRGVRPVHPPAELHPIAIRPLAIECIDGRIFPRTPSAVMYRRSKIALRAGLPPARVHDLRHAHVTAGLAAGVPMKVLSARVGHASIQITADLYAHVTRDIDRAAAETIGGVLLGEELGQDEIELRIGGEQGV